MSINNPSFIEAFVRKYYPSQGLDVIDSVGEYLIANRRLIPPEIIVALINGITKYNDLSDEEKILLVEELRSR